MRIWTAGVTLVFALVGACSTETEGPTSDDGDEDGKYESLDDIDASACKLEADEERKLVQFVLNDHVQFRCRGATGFVNTGCCLDELTEFTFSTGCPLQAKFAKVDDVTAASGSRQRCVADQPDASEDVGVTELVATSCCTLLCDNAEWDDPTTKKTCRGDSGQFKAHSCCEMNDDTACGGAIWETREEDDGFQRCWAQEGDFADHYAATSCCMDQCFRDSLDDTEVNAPGEIPIECLFPSDNECDGATVTTLGACALELTDEQREQGGEQLGAWGKAMCCAGQDGLDIDLADDCHRRELLGDDLSVCG